MWARRNDENQKKINLKQLEKQIYEQAEKKYQKDGTIPLMMAIGGNRPSLSKDIIQYRVWVKPPPTAKYGDSFVYTSKSLNGINKIIKDKSKKGTFEEPLGVIRDKKSASGFREIELSYNDNVGKRVVPRKQVKKF